MAKKTIISHATSLLKEANKLTDKIGFTPKMDEPENAEQQTAKKTSMPAVADKPAEPALDSVEGISSWLETVKGKADPALVQVVQSQIQVLGLVDSPTMSGMMIDNLVQCLESSLKKSFSEEQKAGIRDAFIRTIQNVEKEKLKQLKEQQKNIGIFKISQRKEAQAEIDEQLALLDKRKVALDEAELKLEQLKKMFPEAHSIKAAIDSYDEELAAIENKYKVL